MKSSRLLALLNVISLILVLIINGLANILPINGKTTGAISAQYPNLFVPAGFTFGIWGVIYLLLICFVIYQLVKTFRDDTLVTDIFGTLFIFSCLLNCAWILAWHYQFPVVSLFVMILLLITLIALYQRVQVLDESSVWDTSKPNSGFIWCVSTPFSMYLGWICVATIANATAVLVYYHWGGFGLSPTFWTFLMIVIATGITSYFLIRFRDFVFGTVTVWAFFGTTMKLLTEKDMVRWTLAYLLITCMVIIAAMIIIVILKKPSRK